MSNYEPTNSRKTLPPDPEPTKVSVPTTLEGLQGGASPSPSISVFVELAHLGDHGSVKKPAEDARTHVTRTAGTDRGCCGYGLSDRFVRRPRGVGLGRGRAARSSQQLPWTFWIRRTGYQRAIWSGRRRVLGDGRERGQVELHPDDVSGSGGDG